MYVPCARPLPTNPRFHCGAKIVAHSHTELLHPHGTDILTFPLMTGRSRSGPTCQPDFIELLP